MSQNVIRKALSAALLIALGFSVSACSGEKDNDSSEVKAVDRVDDAAEQARANAPDADGAIPAESGAPDTDKATANNAGVAAEPEVLTADVGATIYEAHCQACHAQGLLGAPKYGDNAAWSASLAKDKETLYMHSAKGFNKMPAQAVDGVTEAQVKAAVDYMVGSVS